MLLLVWGWMPAWTLAQPLFEGLESALALPPLRALLVLGLEGHYSRILLTRFGSGIAAWNLNVQRLRRLLALGRS